MKKIFVYTMLLALIRLLSGCTGTAFYPYGYSVHGNKVYYKFPFPQGATEIEGADASTFQVVSDGLDSSFADSRYYGVDEKNVFYYGHLLPGGDGPSLKLLSINYAKDKGQCYYKGILIPGADPATFVLKNDDFSMDKEHIFRRGAVMDNDTSVFETFDSSSVVHTANTVSVYDYVVKVPAGSRFRWIAYNYFSIDDSVYRFNDLIKGADVKSFAVLTDWISKTNQHVYYGEKLIEEADPNSFSLLASPYSHDAKHIFFFERMIKDADVATFEIINDKFQCARDKKGLYHEDKKITGYSAEDFANKKPCLKCNEAAIYFAE